LLWWCCRPRPLALAPAALVLGGGHCLLADRRPMARLSNNLYA
jgi:hypothetical protein